MLKKRVNLFGLFIDDISLLRSTELARNSILGGESRSFFTPNLEMLERARKDEDIRHLMNSASVLLPDGIGVVLASHFLNSPIKNKVAGIDFGEALIALCEREGKSVFLLGGESGVAKRAAKKLIKKHPKLKICGIHNGYFEEDDESMIVDKINSANPDALIVCMGFPRQEVFVNKYKNELPSVKVFACLGGALDIWSGRKMRSPKVLRDAHLEWLWRTLFEPQRIVRVAGSIPALMVAAKNGFEKIVLNKSINLKK